MGFIFNDIPLVIRNISFIAISQIIIVFSGIFLISHLGRILGPNSFGIYCIGYAIMGLMIACADIGLSMYGIREIAFTNYISVILLKKIIQIKLILSLIIILIALVILVLFYARDTAYIVYWLFILSLIPSSFSLEWFFSGLEKMEIRAVLRIFASLGILSLCIILVKSPIDLMIIPVIYLMILGTTASLSIIITHLKRFHEFIKSDSIFLSEQTLIVSCLPIGITQVISVFLINADIIICALFVSPDHVGIYSAISRLLSTAVSLVGLVFIPLYPAFCRLNYDSNTTSLKILDLIVKSLMALIFPIICLIICFAYYIVLFLYGHYYLDSVVIMEILIWYLPLAVLSSIFSWHLLSIKRDKEYLYINIILVLLVTMLSSLGSYFGGIFGTAFFMVIAYLLSIFIISFIIREHLGENLIQSVHQFLILLFSGFVVTLICIYYNIPLIFGLLLSLIFYFYIIIKIGILKSKEFEFPFQLFK